jgi:hypothetical protein
MGWSGEKRPGPRISCVCLTVDALSPPHSVRELPEECENPASVGQGGASSGGSHLHIQVGVALAVQMTVPLRRCISHRPADPTAGSSAPGVVEATGFASRFKRKGKGPSGTAIQAPAPKQFPPEMLKQLGLQTGDDGELKDAHIPVPDGVSAPRRWPPPPPP